MIYGKEEAARHAADRLGYRRHGSKTLAGSGMVPLFAGLTERRRSRGD
jgi:hypothetical protein